MKRIFRTKQEIKKEIMKDLFEHGDIYVVGIFVFCLILTLLYYIFI